ncbi:MAG: amino acid permease [Cellulomonas iranensis]|uniref:APC family permease n=1 Tax=Cellulomonas iranensis TaxID=76862 RepID=UPI001B2EF76C|nr:APC family permease [Cellulomonas iranensis]MBO9568080.1 amino acid permease [Cellulomonas iranensis]
MTSPALARRLGLADAVVIGLAAMLGAGVFGVWAPAAQAAGAGLLVGLVVAGAVAWANATSTARLAAAHPVAGGVYAYGRAEVGPWWGFVAGWSFVVGKTASCAAMALTFAAYAAPAAWQRPVAVGAVLLLVVVDLLGVTRTARVARVLVVVVLVALATVVAVGLGVDAPAGLPPVADVLAAGPLGVLQAAGLLFFAFAGYARVATLGEEVRDPARTIPRAVAVALVTVLVVYAVLGAVVLHALGADALAASRAPLADVVAAAGWDAAAPVVRVGAAAGSLGALLALLAGVGRTTLALAREHDLPGWLAAVAPGRATPARATVTVGLVVAVLVALLDLRGAIGFSSAGVLLYYAVAHVAVLRGRTWRATTARRGATTAWAVRVLPVAGLVGCLLLVVTLPPSALVTALAVVAVGVVVRVVLRGRATTP